MSDPAFSQKYLPLKIAAYIIAFLFFDIVLPIYLTLGLGSRAFSSLFLFYLINILSIFYLLKIYSNKRYNLEYKIQYLQEKFNILKDENAKELKNHEALQSKILRYRNLKNISEKLNLSLDVDSVAESLASLAFLNISNNKGVCILYLIDKQLNLQIFKTKKEDIKSTVRAKEGDIFELWVLRHISPLLIEDTKQDFRFDLGKLKIQETRLISSLISLPLLSEHRFLGTLRLDHHQTHFFSQDDLRFLAAISDLGAVALENSELFQRAQDLAIHDTLTSIFTKGYFLERLRDECKRSIRQNTELSLLMLDIDFFKNYNDKFGHIAGDIVLKKLSQTVTESLKELNPIFSRFGGEEFCAALPHINKKEAYKYANILRERVENEKIILRRVETNVTISIGVATLPTDAVDDDELIRKADQAMYQAKHEGRNKVVVSS
jgi:diguanylate cyclase (GGDEF)-like protein